MNINVRKEKESDISQVYDLNKTAFKQVAFSQGVEADLVNKLRDAACDIISLVAVLENQVVGHIIFSPVEINNEVSGMSLSTMAVLPKFQKKGIGSMLIKAGIEEVKKLKNSLIIVLGHPEYYPKFGFVAASKYGLKSKYDVPDEVFMALSFKDIKWDNAVVKYRQEFDIFV